MTRVNLSLALCVRLGFIHNKRYTFYICPLGYRFFIYFLVFTINPKGHICGPDRKSSLGCADESAIKGAWLSV